MILRVDIEDLASMLENAADKARITTAGQSWTQDSAEAIAGQLIIEKLRAGILLEEIV